MPRKALQPCAFPGCARLSNGYYCKIHATRTPEKKPPQHNKRYGRAWREIRQRYAAAHPLCEKCLMAGRWRMAEEIHHILPLREGGGNEPENLMALCRKCHGAIHKKARGRGG